MGCCLPKCNNLLHDHKIFKCGTCKRKIAYCKTCNVPRGIRCCGNIYKIADSTFCMTNGHEQFNVSCPCSRSMNYCYTCDDPPGQFKCCGNTYTPRSKVQPFIKPPVEKCNNYGENKIGKGLYYHCVCYKCRGYMTNGSCSRCEAKKCKTCHKDSDHVVGGYCVNCVPMKCAKCDRDAKPGYTICDNHYECFYCHLKPYDNGWNAGKNVVVRDYMCRRCNHPHEDSACNHQIFYKKWSDDIIPSVKDCGCTNSYTEWVPRCKHEMSDIESFKRLKK